VSSTDASTQLALYKGFDDLIPYIVSCNNGYAYIPGILCPSYTDAGFRIFRIKKNLIADLPPTF